MVQTGCYRIGLYLETICENRGAGQRDDQVALLYPSIEAAPPTRILTEESREFVRTSEELRDRRDCLDRVRSIRDSFERPVNGIQHWLDIIRKVLLAGGFTCWIIRVSLRYME